MSIPGATPGASRVRPPGWTGQHPQANPLAHPGQPPGHPRMGVSSLSPRPCVSCRPGSRRSGHPSPLGRGRLACPDAQSISEDAPRALTIPSSGKGRFRFPLHHLGGRQHRGGSVGFVALFPSRTTDAFCNLGEITYNFSRLRPPLPPGNRGGHPKPPAAAACPPRTRAGRVASGWGQRAGSRPRGMTAPGTQRRAGAAGGC